MTCLNSFKGEFAVVPTDKICGRSLSKISVDMNSIFMKLCHMTNMTKRSHNSEILIFEVIFVDVRLKKNIVFNKTVGGAIIQIVHFFDHGYLEEEKSMIQSFTVPFGAKYLTVMVINVPPYETCSLTQLFIPTVPV
jgi:hypothetical protein